MAPGGEFQKEDRNSGRIVVRRLLMAPYMPIKSQHCHQLGQLMMQPLLHPRNRIWVLEAGRLVGYRFLRQNLNTSWPNYVDPTQPNSTRVPLICDLANPQTELS